jgi:hypothetical protein
MKKARSCPLGAGHEEDRDLRHDYPPDIPNEAILSGELDPETLAKKVTAPIIESLREKLSKIDVSKYKTEK